jgi:hypothetical protein
LLTMFGKLRNYWDCPVRIRYMPALFVAIAIVLAIVVAGKIILPVVEVSAKFYVKYFNLGVSILLFFIGVTVVIFEMAMNNFLVILLSAVPFFFGYCLFGERNSQD